MVIWGLRLWCIGFRFEIWELWGSGFWVQGRDSDLGASRRYIVIIMTIMYLGFRMLEVDLCSSARELELKLPQFVHLLYGLVSLLQQDG